MRTAIETSNKAELIFFTTAHNAYKARAYEFADSKASVLGEFLPAKLGMEPDETVIAMAATTDYSGYMLFFFANGKGAKVPLESYKTKTYRKRLLNAYSDKAPLVYAAHSTEDRELALYSSNNKVLIADTAFIAAKATKNTIGVSVMAQKGKNTLARVVPLHESGIIGCDYYRTKNIPAVGHFLRESDLESTQMALE